MTPRQQAYQVYLSSVHWADLRDTVLARDGHRCTRCPSRHRLQVHHLFYRARFEDTQPDDLVTLCRKCHEHEHGINLKKSKQKRQKQRPEAQPMKAEKVQIKDFKSLMLARGLMQINRAEFKALKAQFTSQRKIVGSAYAGKHWLNGKSFAE